MFKVHNSSQSESNRLKWVKIESSLQKGFLGKIFILDLAANNAAGQG